MLPKITIITPSYNQASFLEQSIDSVLSQNYANLEYIVIDGGSTDGSAALIKKYEKYLAYWVSEPDNGQSHAINKGIGKATGDIINWLNSDDYYEPDAFRIVADGFSDQATMALCARSNVVCNGKVLRQTTGTDVFADNFAKTLGWARIDQPETFFRTAAFRKVGLLNESLHYVMDREWWMRFLLLFGLEAIVKTEDVIANFRIHDRSKTGAHKEKFDRENIDLYFSFALKYGLGDQADFMRSIFPNATQLSEAFPKIIEPTLARRVIEYFLLYKADEFYYQLDFKTARAIVRFIKDAEYDDLGNALKNRIDFRMRFFPAKLISLLRR